MPSQSSREANPGDEWTRRRYLAAVGIAGALAGCTGGGGRDGGSGDAAPTDDAEGDSGPNAEPTTQEPSQPADGTTRAATGGTDSDSCPSPSEYERREIPTVAGEAIASCEVPASGFSVQSKPNQLSMNVGGTSLGISSRAFPNRSVEEREEQLREQEDYAAVTDRYDPSSGAAVMATQSDGDVPNVVRALLPNSSGGVVELAVTVVGQVECAAAVGAVQTRAIDTARIV